MMEYTFLIAEKCIALISTRDFQIRDDLKAFQSKEKKNKDLIIEILFDTESFQIDTSWKEIAKDIFEKDGNIIQRYHWKNDEYIYRMEPNGRDEPCRIGVPKDFANDFCENGNILNYLALDRLMVKYFDCIYFHSSLLLYNKESILFSAPSHGGKSTQAKLWEKYENALVLNGDKALLKIESDQLIAYGSPIAGTSKIYQNIGAPVKMIIFIKKGTENHITKFALKDAYKHLYSEMIKSSWDEKYNKKVLGMVETILQNIPVMELECTPDKRAVDCVLQYMKRAN